MVDTANNYSIQQSISDAWRDAHPEEENAGDVRTAALAAVAARNTAVAKADIATTQAGLASDSADAASDSAGAASDSADDASGFATAASGSADDASGFATAASDSATAAGGSATAASGSAGLASDFADNALASQNAASSFADAAALSAGKHLANHATSGRVAAATAGAGAIYYDTSVSKLGISTGSIWVDAMGAEITE
jgi:hypothetical protein